MLCGKARLTKPVDHKAVGKACLKDILQGPMKVEVLLRLTGDCLASIAMRRAIALCPGHKAWMLRRENEYAVFDKQPVHSIEEVIYWKRPW